MKAEFRLVIEGAAEEEKECLLTILG